MNSPAVIKPLGIVVKLHVFVQILLKVVNAEGFILGAE